MSILVLCFCSCGSSTLVGTVVVAAVTATLMLLPVVVVVLILSSGLWEASQPVSIKNIITRTLLAFVLTQCFA